MGNKLLERINRFCELAENKNIRLAIDFLDEEVQETKAAIEQNDFEEIIDGFGDIAFVAINGIYKAFRNKGQNPELAHKNTVLVLTRISTANMNKSSDEFPDGYKSLEMTPTGDGRYFFKKNGKVIKPDGWKVPTYGDLYETN